MTKSRAFLLMHLNLGKIFLVLQDLPKVGLFLLMHLDLGKIFLVMYSIVPIKHISMWSKKNPDIQYI